MANMSYCMFENTSRDMSDCVEAMKRFNELENDADQEVFDSGIDVSIVKNGPNRLEALSDYERQGLLSALAYAAEMLELADSELLAEAGVDLKRLAA